MRPVQIKGSERVLLVGRTGSGKTYAAMTLLAPVPRLIAVDLDGSLDEYGFDNPSDSTRRRLENGQPMRVRVQEIDVALAYLESALEVGGCIVYIDEVYAVIEQTKRGGPEAVNAIWTRGRKRNVGGWVASQRPTSLPLTLISEADWYFVFRLTLDEDRKRMAAFVGPEVEDVIHDKHGFFVANAEWERPDYYRQLNTSLKFSGLPVKERITA